MVRRAVLDRGDELAADDRALSDLPPSAGRSSRRAVPWPGGGGRWLVWLGRALVWAVIITVGYRGVLAIVGGQGSPSTRNAPASGGAQSAFPVTAASAYAMEFGTVYLNFSPSTAATRAQELAAFMPAGTTSELGWNGVGTQRLADEQVSSVSVTGAHTAVVTLLARLETGKMIELGVPVYASGTSLAVVGEPALLPAPAKAVVPASSQGVSDQAAPAALAAQLTAFFQAFASGDEATLARFVTPDANVTGLGGSVTLQAVNSVYAPAGGTTRKVLATVTWQLPSQSAVPATLQMTYQLTVVLRGGTWDVRSIGAATQQAQGPP